ncbi:MAG TPA: hypothetical protein PLO41_20745 [Rubrivivax sp.]|nr:hypothetical protein [Rubrivivax sp.]
MALITQAVLAKAAVAVDAMGQAERVRLADEVFAHQPNLLASVLVLQRMGVSLAQMDVPIYILLVAYQAMKTSGPTWPVISEDIQEACLRRLAGRVRFAEGLGHGLLQRSAQQYIDEHREPYLLAFAYGYLKENDLLGARTEAEKSLMLATLNLVDCIAFVAARIQPASSARSLPTSP